MVLDEPAAGLDPRARIELREMIRTLADERQDDPHQLAHPHRAGRRSATWWASWSAGELLAVGTVEEIQREERMRERAVEFRVLGRMDELADGSACGRAIGGAGRRRVGRLGPRRRREAEADLLAEAIRAGFRVVAFGSRRQTLEDVFLQVTKGRCNDGLCLQSRPSYEERRSHLFPPGDGPVPFRPGGTIDNSPAYRGTGRQFTAVVP